MPAALHISRMFRLCCRPQAAWLAARDLAGCLARKTITAHQCGGPDLRLLGACTDQPKSAIFSSPFMPSSRFSGLISRWMTCFEWQYSSARASEAMYLHPPELSQYRTTLLCAPKETGHDQQRSMHVYPCLVPVPSLEWLHVGAACSCSNPSLCGSCRL